MQGFSLGDVDGAAAKQESSISMGIVGKIYFGFNSWECVSLIRKKYATTLDFLIREPSAMMAFLCYSGYHILKQKDCEFMRVCAKLKFKMKVNYEC